MSTSTAPRRLPNEPSTTRALPVPLARLHVLRLGYLVIAVGILLTKWPLLLHHPEPWPLYEGVETSMLVALSLLWFLGVRHPLRLLPVLLFEVLWKLIWLAVVVLPAWSDHRLDQATLQVFYACLLVVIPLAVIPWHYVVSRYVTGPADPWRSRVARADGGRQS
jgi:hypothetical protein